MRCNPDRCSDAGGITPDRPSREDLSQIMSCLPVALWQGDYSALALQLESLRQQGVTDLASHIDQNPDFLNSVPNSIRIQVMNEKAETIFKKYHFNSRQISPIECIISENIDIIFGIAYSLFHEMKDYRYDLVLSSENDDKFAFKFTITFLPQTAREYRHVISIVETTAIPSIDVPVPPNSHRYRDLFRNVPVPLVYLDMAGVFRFIAQLKLRHGDHLVEYVKSEPDFPAQFAREIRLREANSAAATLFGLPSPEDFPPEVTHAWSLCPETLRRSFLARITGAEGYAEETRIKAFDGRVVDVIFSITFTTSASDPETNIAAFVDVSDRVRAEAALQALQTDFTHASRLSLMGELAGSIAHEINQPLTGIIATAQIIQRYVRQPQIPICEITELAADIVDDGQRAAAIIANVRSMIAKKETERTATKIQSLLQGAVSFLRKEIQASGLSLSISEGRALPEVLVDPIQIQQVIVNLIMNALQAMAAGSSPERWLKIDLREAADSQLLVTFADSGPGVPSELIDRLFESFMTTKANGLGIGLSICRNIIESHGGRLVAANTPHGAEFSFTLPIVAEQELERT